MAKSVLRLVSPATENRTVERSMPARRPNADIRPREHLTEREVEKLIAAARGNRWGQRDATMILIAFRHGLRASEVCELQWSDVEFETGNLHLRRSKGGATSTHPSLGDELRALRALKREANSPFIFVSERGAPFSVSGLAKLIERAGIGGQDTLQGSCPHAAPRLRLRTGKQGDRYPDAAGLPGPPKHPIDRALH